MTDHDEASRPRSRRPPARRLRVLRAGAVTPNLQRVTLGGDALAGFSPPAPASYVTLYLPDPATSELVLPVFGPRGPEYPAGAPRPLQRTYTPRRFDPDRLELDLDVVLHGPGAAAEWAAAAVPGDEVGVAGPGSGWLPDPDTAWFVLAGDHSALPALATIVEALPAGRTAHVVAEVPSDEDRIDLVSPARLIITWLTTGADGPGSVLEATVRRVHVPPGDGRFWVATESAAVRRIRDHLVADRGLDRSRFTIRAYWKAGEPGA